jgi:hypothetical protein
MVPYPLLNNAWRDRPFLTTRLKEFIRLQLSPPAIQHKFGQSHGSGGWPSTFICAQAGLRQIMSAGCCKAYQYCQLHILANFSLLLLGALLVPCMRGFQDCSCWGTLKRLVRHHSIAESTLQCMLGCVSVPYLTFCFTADLPYGFWAGPWHDSFYHRALSTITIQACRTYAAWPLQRHD